MICAASVGQAALALAAAAVLSPPLTAPIEATWYALVRHIPFWEVIDANFDPDMAFRPSAYVAAAGVVFVAVAILRKTPAPVRSPARSARPAASAAPASTAS